MGKFVYDNSQQFKILTEEQVRTVHEKALYVLENLGIIVDYDEALDILEEAGCQVDRETMKVKYPREIVEKCIESAPASFDLYDREGNFYCTFGDGKTRFNPGSSAGNILESDGETVRLSSVKDLKLLTKVAQSLPEIDFVSSSIVCEEAPGELGSQYLYFTEMQHSTKPIIGGSTDLEGVPRTFRLLKAVLGSEENVRTKPYTIFDICVTSPLKWSAIGARNIVDCVKMDIPIEMISAQIAGATGYLESRRNHSYNDLLRIGYHQSINLPCNCMSVMFNRITLYRKLIHSCRYYRCCNDRYFRRSGYQPCNDCRCCSIWFILRRQDVPIIRYNQSGTSRIRFKRV